MQTGEAGDCCLQLHFAARTPFFSPSRLLFLLFPRLLPAPHYFAATDQIKRHVALRGRQRPLPEVSTEKPLSPDNNLPLILTLTDSTSPKSVRAWKSSSLVPEPSMHTGRSSSQDLKYSRNTLNW
jgi:hypothetical protein